MLSQSYQQFNNFTKVDRGKFFMGPIIPNERCSIIYIEKVTKDFVVYQDLTFTYGVVWSNINYDLELSKVLKFKHRWIITVGLHSCINKNKFKNECTLLIPLILGIKIRPISRFSTKQRKQIKECKQWIRMCPELGTLCLDRN